MNNSRVAMTLNDIVDKLSSITDSINDIANTIRNIDNSGSSSIDLSKYSEDEIKSMIHELIKYVSLEKSGKLLRLDQVNIGDTLYRVTMSRGRYKESSVTVREITLTRNNFYKIMIEGEYGLTVFSTLEEANRAKDSISSDINHIKLGGTI